MTVLHGFVTRDGGLALWGEADQPSPAGRGAHPFAFAPAGEPRPATLLLPSTSAGPLPSPALGLPPRRGTPRLRPWVVPAVVVPWVTTDLADECGARAAPSLTYLAELCAFAADLVARGRVLPAVLIDGPRPRAIWRPVLSGTDGTRHADLLARMPAACRAERARPGDVDGLPAADTLHAALHHLIDGLVRTRLAESDVTLGGAPWLTALTADGPVPARTADGPARTPGAAADGPARPPGAGADGLAPPPGAGADGLAPARGADGSARTSGAAADGLAPAADGLAPPPGAGGSARTSGAAADGLAPAGGAGAGRAGEFDGRPGELDVLAEALDAWHADATSGTAVRVVLRLSHLHELDPDEPDATSVPGPAGSDATGAPEAGDEPQDAWLLEFFLQPLDEPSLLVSAADVWRDAAAPLRRWTHRPQERLIAGLGRAARLFGDLEAALRVARPAELVLDTEGAHRFLSHAALLEQAGYGVLLPAWWREPQRLGLALDVRSADAAAPVLRDEAADLNTIVSYNWGLSLGGRVLTEDELAVLARVKVPLVRMRGRWVHLDPERLRAGLEFLRRGGGTMTAGDAVRLVRLLPPEEMPLPIAEVRGRGWVADLLSGRLGERLELREPPVDLLGVLRPYQKRGFSWLAFLDGLGLGACLADDMGLGKTVQLLALLVHRRAGPTLLVCPLSVLGNWQREAARFAPALRVRVLHGADRPDPAGLADGADVVLTTYATATRDADALAAVQWDRVVLDEAQHIKNSASGAARAVRRFPARNRFALTGTPVENRLAELWSILDFLNPGLLGSAHTFRNRYAVPIERYADEDAAARLRHATRPFLLRRVKADPAVISDLPDKRHVRHLCGLTAEQATLYRAVLDDMMARLKETTETRRKGIVLAGMTKLKQVCNHPAQLLGDGSPLPGRSGKLERLEEILDAALAGGESALCFTQFTRFGSALVPHLAARFGVPVRYLHGGTPRGARDEMVAAFQADRRPGIFVLSLKAGGTGLNLTAASHVVHVDRWWNPATEAQATDRAFRIGQRRDVSVHTLVCLGTLEERIDRLIADKGVLAERVVGNGEGWLTTLSTDELRDLTRLDPEAVGD
ncbi:SNF2-related protein [Couchioplanes caeruleus]|uniref:DEAD/DEAH box helicase n=1 Tax=Couchioplanes caeruleus TaxID=56438 RepID=UPI00201C0FD1|nr:DEAD/DEAH box helicase [Couchioplanes caeruleus]UQU68306.1 SNF2-related protein [Couchioplanes caeruleus]